MIALRALHRQRVANLQAALEAGASVTVTSNGALATVTIACAEGTFTRCGPDPLTALDSALAALPAR